MSTKQKSNALDLLGKARPNTRTSSGELKNEGGQDEGGKPPAPVKATASDSVRHTIYLDPKVSRALKLAAASGDDPRGRTLSTIVNAALQEMGYGE